MAVSEIRGEVLKGEVLKGISHELMGTETVWAGPAFSVEHRAVAVNGAIVGRDVVKHAPVVYVLAHDVQTDRYMLEREYRAGADAVCYGLPAGFIDDGEDPRAAAVRELREETGVIVSGESLEPVFSRPLMSSQGFTDEEAWCYRADIRGGLETGAVDFDYGEYVRSGWVSFETLDGMLSTGKISGAVSAAIILSEKIRRASEDLQRAGGLSAMDQE